MGYWILKYKKENGKWKYIFFEEEVLVNNWLLAHKEKQYRRLKFLGRDKNYRYKIIPGVQKYQEYFE